MQKNPIFTFALFQENYYQINRNRKITDFLVGFTVAVLMLILIFLSNILKLGNQGFIDQTLPLLAIFIWIIITLVAFVSSKKWMGGGSLTVVCIFGAIVLYGISQVTI